MIMLFWLFDLLALRAGVPDPLDDSWEYGVVARALLAGQGFRTHVIHPPLWTLRDANGTVPVLVHGPLLPVLIAPVLAVVGPGLLDHLAWASALFAALAALALLDLGTRLASAPVGAAGALLFTLSPLTLRAVHHDIALTLGAWLLVLALDQLLRPRPHALRAGLCMGLGALVRPEFLWAAPLLATAAPGVRLRFIGVVLACVALWGWHGAVHAGSPFFNLSSYLLIGYWQGRPGITVMRDFAIPPSAWSAVLSQTLPSLPAKWGEFFPHALKRALLAPTDATGWLVPLGAFSAFHDSRTRLLAGVALALAMIPVAIMTLTLYDPRYLVPFLPLFALGAARGMSDLAGHLPPWMHRPRAWVGLLVLAVLPSTGPALNDAWREARAQRARLRNERTVIHAIGWPTSALSQPIYSDTPDFMAWTLHRTVLWSSQSEYLALPLLASAPESPLRPSRGPDDRALFHALDGRGEIAVSGRIGDALDAKAAADTTQSR
ncbi:MAG: hypothetical protein ABIU54_12005 [Candidatus Eisenbacteria bacterium]